MLILSLSFIKLQNLTVRKKCQDYLFESDPAEFNEDGSIVVRSGKLTITMSNREDFDSLDKTDFSLAEEEDFMKNPVLDSNGIYIPELPDSKV